MGIRHPVLLSLWGLMIGAAALSLTNLAWFVLPMPGTPFVSIATFSVVVRRRDVEPFAPGWATVYRAVAGLLLAAAVVGLVAAAGRVVRHGSGTPGLQVGPAGLLFFLAFVLGWRALVGATPRRAAIVGMVVHLVWVPIVIIDVAMGIGHKGSVPAHPQLWGAALLGVVALAAAMSMLALVAFAGASSLAPDPLRSAPLHASAQIAPWAPASPAPRPSHAMCVDEPPGTAPVILATHECAPARATPMGLLSSELTMTHSANKLFAMALVLPACIPSSGEDGDTRGDQHTLTVNWNVKNADGTPHGCASPFDTLVIVATSVEIDGGYNYQDSVSATVPCTATGSVSLDIYTSGELDFKMPDDPTTYTWTYFPTQEVVIYNTEDSGMNSRADSIERLVTLDADKSVDIELYPEAGFAMFQWQLQSMATSSFITCEAGDVDQVSFSYRDFYDAAAPMVTDMWSCNNIDPDFPYLSEGQVFDAGNGRSRPLPAGSYIGTTRALRGGIEVGREDDSEFTIETGNKVVPLNGTSLLILDR